MVPEAQLDPTEHGLFPTGEGWFVLNARDAQWFYAPGRSAVCESEGDADFSQLGIFLSVLEPGVAMAMYHWEADQEGFLVLSGEALLIVEGKERPLRQWDFVHCPAETKHVIVGAGAAQSVVLAVGAREHQSGADWGGYSVDEAAQRHGAGVEEETSDQHVAYAHLTKREPTRYREGWLPEYAPAAQPRPWWLRWLRSDYDAFINAGIPAGGLFTGAEGIKTAEEAAIYGGTAGLAYDPCYHQACDTIDNLSAVALDQMSDAIAHATLLYAMTRSAVNGTDKASNKAKANMEFRGSLLKK